ncbi:MAG TPA: hypothetical protein EYQ43_09175 [Methyloprofundus sp.]|nr:hypothetical protein [Methyloprofundus sp.]
MIDTYTNLFTVSSFSVSATEYGNATVSEVRTVFDGDSLLSHGLARLYDGGKRGSWCDLQYL